LFARVYRGKWRHKANIKNLEQSIKINVNVLNSKYTCVKSPLGGVFKEVGKPTVYEPICSLNSQLVYCADLHRHLLTNAIKDSLKAIFL